MSLMPLLPAANAQSDYCDTPAMGTWIWHLQLISVPPTITALALVSSNAPLATLAESESGPSEDLTLKIWHELIPPPGACAYIGPDPPGISVQVDATWHYVLTATGNPTIPPGGGGYAYAGAMAMFLGQAITFSPTSPQMIEPLGSINQTAVGSVTSPTALTDGDYIIYAHTVASAIGGGGIRRLCIFKPKRHVSGYLPVPDGI